MSLLIKNGLVVNADGRFQGDVFVEGERIKAVGTDLDLPADEVVDASGCYVLPGAIDPHTHISTEFTGAVSQDDFVTGTTAAACGGVTSFIDFALQKKGETLAETLERKKAMAVGKAALDYALHPIIVEPRPDIIGEVKKACLEYGTPSFKLFMVYDIRVDDGVLLGLLSETGKYGGLIQVHAENPDIVDFMNDRLAGEGKLGLPYHAASRPNLAEEEAVSRAAKLAELTGGALYVVHLSTKEGLAKVKEARERGVEIYAETCPHYLLLDESRYLEPGFEGAKYIISPPLRDKASGQALWRGLAQGQVNTLATDHCPFDYRGVKDRFGTDDYRKVANGAGGIETSLMLAHTHGVGGGRISLERLVAVTSANTARIFGLENKGAIAPGKDADMVVFDPAQKFTITRDKLHMNVDYSMFEGFKVTGMPRNVYSRGMQVARWRDDRMDFTGQPGWGRFVRRVPGKR